MPQAQVIQIITWIATSLGATFVTKGYLTGDQLTTVVALIASAVTLGWGIYANMAKQRISSVAAMPQVQTIQLNDAAMAKAIPATNVIPAPAPPSSKPSV